MLLPQYYFLIIFPFSRLCSLERFHSPSFFLSSYVTHARFPTGLHFFCIPNFGHISYSCDCCALSLNWLQQYPRSIPLCRSAPGTLLSAPILNPSASLRSILISSKLPPTTRLLCLIFCSSPTWTVWIAPFFLSTSTCSYSATAYRLSSAFFPYLAAPYGCSPVSYRTEFSAIRYR